MNCADIFNKKKEFNYKKLCEVLNDNIGSYVYFKKPNEHPIQGNIIRVTESSERYIDNYFCIGESMTYRDITITFLELASTPNWFMYTRKDLLCNASYYNRESFLIESSEPDLSYFVPGCCYRITEGDEESYEGIYISNTVHNNIIDLTFVKKDENSIIGVNFITLGLTKDNAENVRIKRLE